MLLEHEPDELREAFDSVMAHPGAMEALIYDLGGTVLLAQHWEEDPSMVLKQIEVLQSVSTAPAIAGPYAAVPADYHARGCWPQPRPSFVSCTQVTWRTPDAKARHHRR
ncbi:MAG TPA: hypothetical protein EYQ31_07565 [Candidatus Handelsmanbacteria bacterium]|nr:hypothetical protein [Candidatus Handelsmanbacteria bacterium]